jgi:hypothetical protein
MNGRVLARRLIILQYLRLDILLLNPHIPNVYVVSDGFIHSRQLLIQ